MYILLPEPTLSSLSYLVTQFRCKQGFNLVNGVCVDVNECAGSNLVADCQNDCYNTDGSYTCLCPNSKYPHYPVDDFDRNSLFLIGPGISSSLSEENSTTKTKNKGRRFQTTSSGKFLPRYFLPPWKCPRQKNWSTSEAFYHLHGERVRQRIVSTI